jgi:hypothetical protein
MRPALIQFEPVSPVSGFFKLRCYFLSGGINWKVVVVPNPSEPLFLGGRSAFRRHKTRSGVMIQSRDTQYVCVRNTAANRNHLCAGAADPIPNRLKTPMGVTMPKKTKPRIILVETNDKLPRAPSKLCLQHHNSRKNQAENDEKRARDHTDRANVRQFAR